MATMTSSLELLKKDPNLDQNDTFNIKTMLNDNWDKIDDFSKDTKTQIENLKDFLNYMPINGGTFDGNEVSGPVIDGGNY